MYDGTKQLLFAIFCMPRRISWIKILIALFLVAGLPLFIWAVATQRIELRKRAATAEPTAICWNRVIFFNGTYNWPNSCKGSPRLDLACTQILVPLTGDEITGYKQWVSAGSPPIPGCGTPTTPTPLGGECSLCGSNANCQPGLVCQYVPTPTPNCPSGPNGPCSVPASASYQACVKPDGSSKCPAIPPTPPPSSPTPTPRPSCVMPPACAYNTPPCTYAVAGVTYCPRPTPPCVMPPACAYNTPPCTYAVRGVTYCPRPTPTCVAPPACAYSNPPCTYAVQGVTYCPIQPTPSATPPPGCLYRQVQCFRAPCPPVLVCPSPTPIPQPTVIPETCVRGKPLVTLSPNNQSGNPGQTLTYIANIVNTDTQPCASSTFNFGGQTDVGFTSRYDYGSMPIPASAAAHMNVYITSPTTDPYPDTRSLPISLTANNTVSNMSATAYAAYTLVKPAPQPLTFKVRFAGVSGAQASGATMKAKFYLQDGTVLPLSTPLTLSHVGNGVYQATATLANPLPVGTPLKVQIKGEKHLAILFCKESGQTGPCSVNEYMRPTSYVFDFTGVPLPPGDLNQDGKVDNADVKILTDLFAKPSTQVTAADLKTGDVDYSGTINGFDLNLILQTLETRYDEQ